MNEDLKPLYDIESLWEVRFNVPGVMVKYEHKEYTALTRLVDFKNHRYLFSDFSRVEPENIIDINKNIGMTRKAELQEMALRLINTVKPITMPYLPEKMKVYVEDLGDYVGFLYFRSDREPEDMIPVKKFFKVVRDPVINFFPVTWSEFNSYKEELENVDKTQQGAV